MDNTTSKELIEALQGIQAELKRMNQSLAKLSPASQPSFNPAGRSNAVSARPSSAPPRGKGNYGRPSKGPDFNGEDSEPAASRFPRKKGSTRSSAGPSRPPGKSSPKKGGGYPKKSR